MWWMPIITLSIIQLPSFSLNNGGRSSFPGDIITLFSAYCLSPELPIGAGSFDHCPSPFHFFAGSCSKEHFMPFTHEPFDVQDRQYLCMSCPRFENMLLLLRPWNILFERSICLCCSFARMSFTIALDFCTLLSFVYIEEREELEHNLPTRMHR